MRSRVEQVPESGVGSYRLGRHIHHDPRSRNFPADTAPALVTTIHTHHGPVLDQGNLGSCTGNALAQCLNTDPLFTGNLLTEDDARRIYSEATAIDAFPGQWPPTDTGSDGLDVCKAAKAEGLITAYRHTFSGDDLRRALVLGPVIVGTVWYHSMFTPAPNDGRIPVKPSSGVAGGHEYLLWALDVSRRRVWMLNSWGAGWGVNGGAYLTWSDLDLLLARGGDCTVPVR